MAISGFVEKSQLIELLFTRLIDATSGNDYLAGIWMVFISDHLDLARI